MSGEPQNFATSRGCDVTLLAGGLRVVELRTWLPSVLFPYATFIEHYLTAFDYFYAQLITPLLPAPTDCIEIIEVGLEQAFAAVITPDAVIRQSPKAPARKPKPAAFKAAPVRRAPAGRVADG